MGVVQTPKFNNPHQFGSSVVSTLDSVVRGSLVLRSTPLLQATFHDPELQLDLLCSDGASNRYTLISP